MGDYKDILNYTDNDSVDLILIDPPYGTAKGMPLDGWGDNGEKVEWDTPIDPSEIYDIANKVLKKYAKIIIFSQEPYTARLITRGGGNISFNYKMIWDKKHFANPLAAKKAPLSYYEDIVVLNKVFQTEYDDNNRLYFGMIMTHINKSKKEIVSEIGQRADHCFRTKTTQFTLPSEKTYQDLTDKYNLKGMDGYIEYDNFTRESTTSVFNLPEGKNHISNIWGYKKESSGYHPTQKPIALLKDIIKTYTNAGDLVVDFFMGSGSTAVACQGTRRRFIGIEKEMKYFDIAKKRLS
ncbi:MAG: site-specific DNA-methyltransferase [Endozoicomonadaceae bacterium]|nr:site-specific DNA-methyltransferase [Endozoicomonadaceae bacterium]